MDNKESEDIPAKAAPASASTKGDVGLPMNKMIIAVVAIMSYTCNSTKIC